MALSAVDTARRPTKGVGRMAWFVRRASSSQQCDGATSLVASTLGRNVLEATFAPTTTRVGLRSQVVGRRSATEIRKLHKLTLLHV